MKSILISLSAGLVLSASSATAATFAGNGNSGFGGPVGEGSLDITDDGSTLDFSFTRGTGDFNDTLVIYLDTTGGGFSGTSSFTDTGDNLRQGISGFDGTNRSTVNFAAGFEADFALAFNVATADFAGLWSLDNAANFSFVTSANLVGTEVDDATFDFSVSLADLGVTPGASFDFVATYLNDTNAFRSDEGIGAGIAPGNPGNTAVTFTGSETYTTIPEPSSMLLGAFGSLLLLRRSRRS